MNSSSMEALLLLINGALLVLLPVLMLLLLPMSISGFLPTTGGNPLGLGLMAGGGPLDILFTASLLWF